MKQYKYLTLQKRELFEREYAVGARLADIADMLGTHLATAYKELARGGVLDEFGDPVLDEKKRQAYTAQSWLSSACRKASDAKGDA